MNRWLSVVAIVLSALAVGVVVVQKPSGGEGGLEPAPRLDEGAEASQGASAAESERRLAALEVAVTSLMRRLDALERAPVPAQALLQAGQAPDPANPERRQLEALRSDVDALLTGDALGTDAGRARLKEVVRSIQDEVFAERVEQRTAAREQARTERLKKLVEEARLSSSQEQDLVRLLEDEKQRRQTLFEQARSGDRPRNEVFGEFRAVRQKTDEDAQRLLSSDQFEKYQAMRSEEGRNRGGGWGGGHGPGGSGEPGRPGRPGRQ